MSDSLKSKRAVITGAGGGIGRATALALHRCGAVIAVLDIDTAAAEQTVAAVRSEAGTAHAITASVADSGAVARGFAEVDRLLGGVDILINNAGVSGNKPALEIEDAEWRNVVGVNLDGTFYCSREAGRRMQRQRSGTIVNVGSIYALSAAPNRLSYCATKASVEMMTRVLAVEWAAHGIRVNGVAPGYVQSPFIEKLAAEGRVDLGALKRRTPQGRFATNEEIADAILYLCEPRTAHITGQMLPVDGGWTAYGYV